HQVLCTQIDRLDLHGFYEIQRDHILGRSGTSADGTQFLFKGIKNNINAIRSYEGIDYCWVEEANKVSRYSWEILTPTIRKKGSEIIIPFNPELEEDYTYKRYVKQADPVNSAVVHMTFRDNPWFPDTELRVDMEHCRETDPDAYQNIWEGLPRQNLEGAVYA